jgi:hypothetical protein
MLITHFCDHQNIYYFYIQSGVLIGIHSNLQRILFQKSNLLKRKKKKENSLKRVHKKSILFNKKELNAIDNYCKKYKVKNRSKLMREFIIGSILEKFDEDYPSLFEDQPNLFAAEPQNKKQY